ncbi:MAG: phospholipase D-like domain-containing protein, partial [Muribaculaceae bacterium]|nr:phospholipase D-like domain-containing protein [Muribaculaceae bacterium]
MPLDILKYKQTYNKIDDDIAHDFYLPTMANSVCYDRMSGYFGSTVFIIAWDALKTFVANGGRMRLICSPVLSDDDINAILKGEKAQSDKLLKEALRQELENIWKDEKLRKPFQVLAALISQNIIEIKIAYGNAHPSFKQLFHDKVGIFSDGVNNIAFRGSVNETYKGLSNSGNLESISVFTSWNNESDAERVLHDVNLFKRLWNNKAPGVVVTSLPPDIKNYITKNCHETSWQELVDEISIEVQTVVNWSADITGSRLPRNHQRTALENWVSNNHCGILEHATGSGKTFTSLCAIRRGIQDGKSIL